MPRGVRKDTGGAAEAEPEEEVSNTLPGVATLDEALAASARPVEEPDALAPGEADIDDFEPLDDEPVEVSSTDERPIDDD